jgi:ubiquinone/menaquinone biosynthesis C-methylase UbiE
MIADNSIGYSSKFIRELFDKHASSYKVIERFSFGLMKRWRRKCVEKIQFFEEMTICDAMSGTGSLFSIMAQSVKNNTAIVALDSSSKMNSIARKRLCFRRLMMVEFREEDFLNNRLPDNSIDAVVCTFGLKTVFPGNYVKLANETFRILKPGGQVSFIEASVPRSVIGSLLFFFFLNYMVPCLNWLLRTNYCSQQLLSSYIKQFGDCRQIVNTFNKNGFDVIYYSLDAGMATGFFGRKYTASLF